MMEHAYQGDMPVCSTCFRPRTEHAETAIQSLTPQDAVAPCEMCGKEKELCACRLLDKIAFAGAVRHTERNDESDAAMLELERQRQLQQDTVEIYRPTDVEVMKVQRHHSGKEIAEMMAEHEAFCCLSFNSKPNWEELYENHFIDIEQKIEAFRAKLFAAKGAVAKKRMQEISKLTPEEREQYKRDARKMVSRVGPEAKAKKDKKEWKELLKSLIKVSGMSEGDASNHLKKMYLESGKEIPE